MIKLIMRIRHRSKKILHHRHTGKLAHGQYTAYGLLLLMLLATSAPLIMVSRALAQAAPSTPASGDGIFAVVQEGPPTERPTITSPVQNRVFSVTDVPRVIGDCQPGTAIQIFKNEVFAGATLCNDNGRYAVDVDLFQGTNILIARSLGKTNQAGPESLPVTVVKGVLSINNPEDKLRAPFYISSDFLYKGVNVGKPLEWNLDIGGGLAPYAVSVSWGDGKTDLISRSGNGRFTVSHIYDKSAQTADGSFVTTIIATDQQGTKSFIKLVAIVSGTTPEGIVGEVKRGYDLSGVLRMAWQLFIGAVAILLAYWLGEKRELYVQRRHAVVR